MSVIALITRHRFSQNFIVNLPGSIVACCFNTIQIQIGSTLFKYRRIIKLVCLSRIQVILGMARSHGPPQTARAAACQQI